MERDMQQLLKKLEAVSYKSSTIREQIIGHGAHNIDEINFNIDDIFTLASELKNSKLHDPSHKANT
jgi:hypothetical protein